MASKYNLETRDERIERMHRNNPGRPIELCTAVVDAIWDKRRELINSKIPDRFADASLADLGYLTKEVVDSVQVMFDPPAKDNDKVGVIFCGPAGSGKTHAAYAVIHAIRDKNPEMIAFMTTYSNVFTALKSEFMSDSHDEMSSMWDRLNNDSGMYDGLLFIDDLSSQKLTDFEADKMTMFIDNRVNSYMPFMITTNVKPEDFKMVFGDRLASRLLGFCEIVLFSERDLRMDPIEEEEKTGTE